MSFPPCRRELQEVYRHQHRPRALKRALITFLLTLAGVVCGCSPASNANNANSAGASPKPAGDGNANSHSSSSQSASIDIKEPERYSVTMTISAQETASETPTPMSTQQLNLAKLGSDRRWVFVFPSQLGQIAYLEKSGLQYIVFFERKQYVELTPDALGFQLGDVLTPHSIADRLKQAQSEMLGLEPVNGRTATKYRITSVAGAVTQPGGAIYVDQETGLPLRSELNRAKARVIVEVRDVQLNPDRAQFDVPVGMKKVTQREARQQIDGFANALRIFADLISGAPSAPDSRAHQLAGNKNANRGR